MSESRPQTINIFNQALEYASAHDRDEYLERACGGDAELRAQVVELLRAHNDAGDFLRGAAPGDPLTAETAPSHAWTHTQIGPYRLMEPIGEGGMGLVFVAEQQQPVRRLVALKVIKPGMTTREVSARFEVERQALALMDHPNIARVLDAGTTESGQPFFVMELVRGVPVTDYCDQAELTVRERLELFLSVCQAVQHAHQKGIIHRDLKPSNVLVTVLDGKPVAKIIDFGVAKAIGQQLSDRTVYTRFMQMIGTPLYMSPEQAAMSAVDVDTRSDIYSLGVVLYELLTGTTPFEKERLKDAGFDEMRRIIREEEPPRPSTRISTLARRATAVSSQRKTDPKRLSQSLAGDLDWIVIKALAKDRNERYATAKELADDVQRFLEDRPIAARPPTWTDRLRKWARRHRALVRAAALVLALTVVALAAGAVLLGIKNSQLAAANEQERLQRQQADANLKKAREAVDKMFMRVGKELGNHPHMEKIRRDILQQALGFYEDFLKQKGDDPVLRSETADAYLRTAEIHRMLRDYVPAERDCKRAVEIMEALALEEPTSLEYRKLLWVAYHDLASTFREKHDFKSAEAWCDKAIASVEQATHEFPDHPDVDQRLAKLHGNRGMVLWQAGRLKESEQEYNAALRVYDAVLARSPDDPRLCRDRAIGYVNRGSLLESMGRMDEAEQSMRSALKLLDRLTPAPGDEMEHLRPLCYAHAWLGDIVKERGALTEAEQCYNTAIAGYARLRERYPASIEYAFNLAMMKNNLGIVLAYLRPADAEKANLEAIAIWQRYAKELPTDPVNFPKWLSHSSGNLAFHLMHCPELELRKPQRALELATQALELLPKTAGSWNNLGMARYRNKDFAGAAEALKKGIAIAEEAKDVSPLEWYFLAMTYWKLDRKDEARKAFARADEERAKDAEGLARSWFHAEEVRRGRAEAMALLGL